MGDKIITDHHTVYCIRKKDRDYHEKEMKTVRDDAKYEHGDFKMLLTNSNWDLFDNLIDPNLQWEVMLDVVLNILSIMCPFIKVFARKTIIPWLSQKIYHAIREKKTLVKKYNRTKDPDDLRNMEITRNSLNTMIKRAKRSFIKKFKKECKKSQEMLVHYH